MSESTDSTTRCKRSHSIGSSDDDIDSDQDKRKKSKKSKKVKKAKHKHEKKKKRKIESKEKRHKSMLLDPPHDLDVDEREIAAFKQAVQGHKSKSQQVDLTRLLGSSSSEIAASLGLPVGLIRTSETRDSMSQQYSKQLFGGGDENPATLQRMKRERTAQRAMEKARQVVAARYEANKQNGDSSNAASAMMDRFRVGQK